MYDLSTFSLHDMTDCGAALHKIGVGATSREEVGQRMAQYLYANLRDHQTGTECCALVRLFMTQPYGELDADCRRLVQEVLGGVPDSPSAPCLTLMGTAGERPEWNDTKNSRRYRVVPLGSEQFVAQFPMFSQLLKQMGVEVQAILNADHTLLADREERTYNVFHVPAAVGSPFIPVQENFVVPFGVRSVLGFGGLLPSGQLFAVIIFSKVQISRETADLFKAVALSAKLALLPFDGLPGPNGPARDKVDLARTRSELTTLRRLHEVQQDTVAVQTARLEGALKEARLRAQELEESQKDLRRQTRLFESMLRGMGEGVVVTDLDGRVLLVNEVAKRVLGLSLYQPASPNMQPAPPVEPTGDQPPEPKDMAQAGAGRVPLLGVLQGKVTGAEVYVDPGSGVGGTWLSVNARRLRDDRGLVKANLLVFHDITQRKRAEEALKQSEERFGSFVRSTDDGIVTLDGRGLITFWNPGAEKLFGYAQDEVLGKPMTLLMPERFRKRHERGIERASAAGHLTGAGNMFELVGLRKDGTEFPHELSLSSWTTRNGVFFTGIVRDITERKRTEEELSGSEKRLRAILDHSPGLVFLKDHEGRYLQINRQFERAFHITSEQVIGKTDAAIFPPEQAAAFRANDLRVFQTGRPLEIEEVAMHDDGPHTSIVSKFPLYGGDGEFYALCGMTTDITERKRVEDALRQSEERYRSIFENAVEGIFQTTLDGKYLTVNPALARMYRYDSPDDMIATITDIAGQVYVDPGRRDEFIRLMQEQETVNGFEALVYRKDGSFIWISESVRKLRDRAGVLVGYEGTVEDITQRKLAEQRLRATLDQVRTLSGRVATVQEEERTRIARELHDELGGGLTCLKIDLSRLTTTVGDDIGADAGAKLDHKIRSMIEQIDTTIASVQRLVTELHPSVLHDLGLVAAIEWQCQDFRMRTGIPCICVTSADDIAMEPERATALFRICQEALTNTARHAQATAVTVKLESWNNYSLRLVVADNGVGIPDKKVSDRRSLGLLGMKERAALFGGEVTIQGHPGKGTTVTGCLSVVSDSMNHKGHPC